MPTVNFLSGFACILLLTISTVEALAGPPEEGRLGEAHLASLARSYCSVSGGLSNISLYLSREGFYGVRNERVAECMRAYLDSVASCLPQAQQGVFSDGFESGGTAEWTLAPVGN